MAGAVQGGLDSQGERSVAKGGLRIVNPFAGRASPAPAYDTSCRRRTGMPDVQPVPPETLQRLCTLL